MTCTIQKERISKGMYYHRCASLMAYNFLYPQWILEACSDRAAKQSTKLHHFRDHWSLTTFVTKNVTVLGKKKILNSHKKLQYKALSILCNYLFTSVEQIWACTAKAAVHVNTVHVRRSCKTIIVKGSD